MLDVVGGDAGAAATVDVDLINGSVNHSRSLLGLHELVYVQLVQGAQLDVAEERTVDFRWSTLHALRGGGVLIRERCHAVHIEQRSSRAGAG